MSKDRIAGWGTLASFIESGTPVQIPFRGSPWSTVIFNPREGSLTLFVESEDGVGNTPPPIDITVRPGEFEQRRGWFVSTLRKDLFFHFYCFVCALSDELIDRGLSLSEAFDIAVASFRDLMERESILSAERQLGLLAELLVLESLNIHRSWAWCLSAWHSGPDSEHDFNLGDADLEVKATLMETRQHIIGSLRQLEASSDRPLYLASFQLTRNDHHDALRLPELFGRIKARVSEEGQGLAKRLVERVESVGYDIRHERFYSMGYGYRTTPVVFDVNSTFPRLIPANLTFPDPHLAQRISQVSYRIDLEGIEADRLESRLASLLGDRNA